MEEKKEEIRFRPSGRLFFAWCVIAAMPAVLLIPLAIAALLLPNPQERGALFILVAGYLIFAAIFVVWARAFIRSMEYIVTDKEVVIRQGVFWRVVKIIPFHKITDLMTVQGPVAKCFGLGTVAIQTAGYSGTYSHPEAKLRGLRDYEHIRGVIAERVSAVQKRNLGE